VITYLSEAIKKDVANKLEPISKIAKLNQLLSRGDAIRPQLEGDPELRANFYKSVLKETSDCFLSEKVIQKEEVRGTI